MIEGFYAPKRKGKTSLSVLEFIRYYENGWYDNVEKVYKPFKEFYSNVTIKGYIEANITKENVIQKMTEFSRKHMSNTLWLLDEIGKLIPSRAWKDEKQTEVVIGLAEDEKLGNVILYTSQPWTPPDTVIRQMTDRYIFPDMGEFKAIVVDYELESVCKVKVDKEKWLSSFGLFNSRAPVV